MKFASFLCMSALGSSFALACADRPPETPESPASTEYGTPTDPVMGTSGYGSGTETQPGGVTSDPLLGTGGTTPGGTVAPGSAAAGGLPGATMPGAPTPGSGGGAGRTSTGMGIGGGPAAGMR